MSVEVVPFGFHYSGEGDDVFSSAAALLMFYIAGGPYFDAPLRVLPDISIQYVLDQRISL